MDEINDIGNVIANTIDNKGEDKRNFFGILRAQRGATDLYNISGDSLNLLNEAYKSNKIGADEYKEGLRNIIEATGNDLGLNVSLVYLDTSTMPKDSEGSTGSSYIVDRKNRKVLIPIDVNKIGDVKELLGTLTEEVAHGKDALEGRQDKKVAEDKSNDEEGLESLGRPANEYVKKKFGEDNNSKIKLTTDGIDLSNADVGEKVGDVITSGDRAFRTGYQSKYKYIQMDFDRAINGGVGLTGSVFRGGASYGLMSIGYSLAFAPEPFATKALGVGFMLGGLIAGAFTASDAVESAQDVYYGVTNQRDKKSVNFGRELLGEDTYDPLNTLSVAGMPILYDQANYTKVMVEGEAAKRAIATNMANQNQISNVTVGTNKSLNIKQQEGQNPQQWQRSRDSLAQNNKNSINKTQPQGNQDYSGNQQLSKGATSNNQQGAPVSKTSDVNKLKVSKGSSDTTQKVVSTVSNNNKVGDLIFYAEEDGYEVYYRTMSLKNYESFKKTGKIPATGETTISPTQGFSEGYDGVLVKFKVKKGTTEKLVNIGVRDESSILADKFPNMPESKSGWGKNHARFKKEDEQLNIGLGKGEGLDIFNENIVEADIINMNNKKEVNKK